MTTFPRYVMAALVLTLAQASIALADLRPAMITNGSDSVAAYLHYPKKAKEKKEQAAITFYCEIKADGKVAHLMLYGAEDKAQFRQAVLTALRSGRFQPASENGKPVPVMIGGTAIFMFRGDQPTVAIALSTADTGKLATLTNYIQPQMLTSSADFRRKMRRSIFDNDLRPSAFVHPSAVAVADVDAQGNMTNVRITKESGSWCGPLLVKTFKGEKFIPAMENGKSVAGQYQLVVNYELMFRADYGSETGSHISRDDWDDNGAF